MDERGRIVAYVRWDVEDLDAAYAELDRRFEAADIAAYGRRTSPGAYARAFSSRDWEAMAAMCTPTFTEYDHRAVAMLGTRHGPEAWAETERALVDLAPDSVVRFDHVRSSSRGALCQLIFQGARDGSNYEIPFLTVAEFGAGGKLERSDIYDHEQLDQARARFAELAAPSTAGRFANAATRALDRGATALGARDWAGFAALLAKDFRIYDRTSFSQLEADGPLWLAGFRQMVEMTSGIPTPQVLATRGERLALGRALWRGAAGDVGPSEVEWLLIIEVDERGDYRAVVSFNPNDLDAAYAELDARYEAGEGAAYGRVSSAGAYARAYASRDWEAVSAMCTATFAEHDHRAVAVLGIRHGPEAWAETERALVELAPDSVVRFKHVRSNARGALSQLTFEGSREGSNYEIPFLSVTELGAGGKLERNDLYDPEQLDQARARFAEVSLPAQAADRFANAATRASERIIAYWRARDWQGLAQMLPAGLRFEDRRRIAQLDGDREQYVEWLRVTGEMTSTEIEVELLATRGDRLALQRRRVQLAGGDVGPSEMANVTVVATNECGDPVAIVHFDDDALDAAYAELDARWRAGECAEYGVAATIHEENVAALERREWDAAAAFFTPTLVVCDRRLVSFGTLHGAAAFLEAVGTMDELAPDARYRADHVRATGRGHFADCVWVGTRDGGAFESPFVVVTELDASGRMERLDFYDPHHLDAALARFEEIKTIAPLPASAPSVPLPAWAKPNAAAATLERWQAAFAAGVDGGDWEPMRGLCAPGMVFEDRRRLALLSGDRELMIASARERARVGARPEGRPVGIAGDRVAVARTLWTGGPPDGRFEIEYLSVVEVDEAGLFTAIIFFDADDALAAQREAWARWAAIEPDVAANLALLGRQVDAFNAHDLGAFLATVADDVVVVDHRRTGMGRLEGAGAFAASIEALWSLAPGTTAAGWHWPAYDRHGVLT